MAKEKPQKSQPKPTKVSSNHTEANKARRIAKAAAEAERNKNKPSDRGLTRLRKRARTAELKRELLVALSLD